MGKRWPASCSSSLNRLLHTDQVLPHPRDSAGSISPPGAHGAHPQSFLGVLTCAGGCLSPLSPSHCLCHLWGPTGTITPPRSRIPQSPHLGTVHAAPINSGFPEPMRLNPDLGCCLSTSRFRGAKKDQLSPWGLFHISKPPWSPGALPNNSLLKMIFIKHKGLPRWH